MFIYSGYSIEELELMVAEYEFAVEESTGKPATSIIVVDDLPF